MLYFCWFGVCVYCVTFCCLTLFWLWVVWVCWCLLRTRLLGLSGWLCLCLGDLVTCLGYWWFCFFLWFACFTRASCGVVYNSVVLLFSSSLRIWFEVLMFIYFGVCVLIVVCWRFGYLWLLDWSWLLGVFDVNGWYCVFAVCVLLLCSLLLIVDCCCSFCGFVCWIVWFVYLLFGYCGVSYYVVFLLIGYCGFWVA